MYKRKKKSKRGNEKVKNMKIGGCGLLCWWAVHLGPPFSEGLLPTCSRQDIRDREPLASERFFGNLAASTLMCRHSVATM